MLSFLPNISSITVKRASLLEYALLLAVGMITLVMSKSEHHDILLHLYYLPTLITGFFLGSYRSRFMALLCILSATLALIPGIWTSSAKLPEPLLLSYSIWAATILLVAILVGKLSDGWRDALESLRREHQKDVLTDSLTGIANRRAYEFELNRRISQWERDGTPVTLILLDIDLFKKLNDRYGHPAGDSVLKGVAEVLQSLIRKADLCCRYGGEEFSIILPGISIAEAAEVADRARTLIEERRFSFNGLLLRTTVSVGFAQVQPCEESSSLMKRADAALYSSKESGRNRIFFHDGIACHQKGTGSAIPANVATPFERLSTTPVEAYADETTGLPSQRVLVEELRRRAAERSRYGTDLVMALVRVEHHNSTPECQIHTKKNLLAITARLICSQLRETDLVVRYGIDTFGILMPSTTVQGATIPLEKICNQANTYRDDQYPSLSYSVSIGATEVARNENPGSTIDNADKALQIAAEGCVEYYHPASFLEKSSLTSSSLIS
ncbi:diguanylate cyclase [Bythopirellula polymerisocia]|uniref:diguanylate cyclase n=1 Tax=Bythopirellula polymerisocia TaxID=2528003 RepID=A0A5C6D145_9BACT|nr:diguanylate cyclase [Bythopirellula polymerisocia]TWU29471.1 Response regulator PleD [Bythopirellula polymerisocia]